MGSAGDTYENKILDAIFGDGRAAGMPATVYVAVFTAAPSDSGGGTEANYAGYAAAAVSNTGAAGGTNWPNASSSQKKNGVIVSLPTATGAQTGNITHFAIYDHATNRAVGNLIAWGALTTPKAVASGDTPSFAVNALVVTCD